jgi:type IX secretion system substrate protein
VISLKNAQIIILLLLPSTKVWSCLCWPLYFCEYAHDEDKKIVIEATVSHHRIYPQNDAVYLKVDQVFRDDIGITSVIKLYGESETADCHVDVLRRFPDGSKVYLILALEYEGEAVWTHSFVNPDDLYENLWEIAPFSCFMVLLDVKNDIVSGPILPDMYEYPLVEFESRLQNCDFPEEVVDNYRCDQLPFLVYPNPTTDGVINIGNLYYYTSITRIRICDLSGRYIYEENIESIPFQKATFSFDFSGLYILEFQCGDTIFYEKLVVQLE